MDPLINAVEAGNREEVERLVAGLSTGDRIDALFHFCTHHDGRPERVDAVRLLLDAGCPPDDDEVALFHVTPLHTAAWFGYAEIVDVLIERGAPIHMRDDEYNSTPLHWAVGACRQQRRRPGGDYARVVNTLLDLGATWDAASHPTGDPEIDAIFAPLLERRLDGVVKRGDGQLLERLLAGGPSQRELDTALCVAAQLGKAEVCRKLLAAGAVVCIPGDAAWTTLNAAVCSGDVATLEVLLESGADVHILNERGGSVWHSLGEDGASREMIDLVIRFGGLSDINVPSKYDYTPLDLAIIEGHTDTIAYLRSLGAEPAREKLPS